MDRRTDGETGERTDGKRLTMGSRFTILEWNHKNIKMAVAFWNFNLIFIYYAHEFIMIGQISIWSNRKKIKTAVISF